VVSDLVLLPGSQVLSGPFSTSRILDQILPAAHAKRRGIFGTQVTTVTPTYLQDMYTIFRAYVAGVIARGATPGETLWGIQFIHPTLNGNAPADDSVTAWPHSTVSQHVAFCPNWVPSTEEFTLQTTENFNIYTRNYQKQLGGPPIYDYPNYLSPGTTGPQVYGKNLERLEAIKQKYDPSCLLRHGPVFKSIGCSKLPGLKFW